MSEVIESILASLPAAEDEHCEQRVHGPWVVLVVDDDEAVHQVTRLVLDDMVFEGRKLLSLHARSGTEAMSIFHSRADIAVALIDVVMETEHAGLRVVEYVRGALGNHSVLLILRTEQAGAIGEQEASTRYEINDYRTKTELSSPRLYSAVLSALRAYRDVLGLHRQPPVTARMIEAAVCVPEPRTLE